MNSEELCSIDAIKLLEDIAIDNKLDVTYVNIEEKSKSSEHSYILYNMLSLF